MIKQLSQRELVLKRILKNKATGFKPTRRKKDSVSPSIIPQYSYVTKQFNSKKPTFH